MKRTSMLVCPYFRLKHYKITTEEEQLFCRCELINKVILDEYYLTEFNYIMLSNFKKKIFRKCLDVCPRI